MNEELERYERTAKNSKSHHWVPRCYLNNFSVVDGPETVYLYTKNGKSMPPTSTKKIAAKNDLYTFQLEANGENTRVMEGVFSELEGQVSPTLQSIAEHKTIPTGEERENLAYFVSLLAVRGPSFSAWLRNMDATREEMEMRALAQHPEALRQRLEKNGVKIENEQEFEKLRTSLLEAKVQMNGGKEHYFRQAMEMGKEIYKVLISQKSWHLLVADGKRHFITSDNPVVIQRVNDVPLHLAEGFGFGTLLLTISPNVCLVLRSFPLKQDVIPASPEDVEYINRSIIRSARLQVYGSIASKIIQSGCDELLNGGESDVATEPLGTWTPYVMVKGIKRDVEVTVLEKNSKPKPPQS